MSVVFISGNRSISELTTPVIDEINRLLTKHDASQIIVGDADGVDSHIQYLFQPDVLYIYCSHLGPRNAVSGANVVQVHSFGSGRTFHTYKDQAMRDSCDVHIGIVTSKLATSGTLNNHEAIIASGKPSYLIQV